VVFDKPRYLGQLVMSTEFHSALEPRYVSGSLTEIRTRPSVRRAEEVLRAYSFWERVRGKKKIREKE